MKANMMMLLVMIMTMRMRMTLDDEDDGQQHYAVKGLPCDDICEQVLVCEAK